MLRAIQNLRKIAQSCRLGAPLEDNLAVWLSESLEQFLAHRAASIDEALGLRAPRGGIPWWREEAMRRRDSLLREFAATHYVGRSVCATARQIRLLSLRYVASAWRFDRVHDAMPEHYRDTPKEWIWRIFKTGAPMPIGERHLRTILSTARK
jgi:hypothetical protein